MYTPVGEPLGIFRRFQRQSDGKFYYKSTEGAEGIFLFSHNQFFSGFSANAEYGAVMSEHPQTGKLVELWKWRRQHDGSLFVLVHHGNSKMGLVLVPVV